MGRSPVLAPISLVMAAVVGCGGPGGTASPGPGGADSADREPQLVYLVCDDAVFEIEGGVEGFEPSDGCHLTETAPDHWDPETLMALQDAPWPPRPGTEASAPAAPTPPPARPGRPTAPSGDSESVGVPDDGALRNGVLLSESEAIRYVPGEIRGGGRFYGTAETVAFVERLAQRMRVRFRGVQLWVGELSAERGGPIPGHRSHQCGRDVDIAFVLRDSRGRTAEPERFLRVGDRGKTARVGGRQYNFDVAQNWAIVQEILLDPEAHVHFIFVAEWLEDWMLEHARQQDVPDAFVSYASYVMREPEDHPHDNHFHVRLACDPDDRRCVDPSGLRPPYGHRTRPDGELERAAQRARELGLGTMRAGQMALRMPPPRAWLSVIRGQSPTNLMWPVRNGYYGRGFGYTREDNPDIPHNGVDIGARTYSIVRASAPGLVLFAGEFRSFGNTVFLLHKNGWITTYAHNERNTVYPGELVRRDDPIALVGSTGVSRGPHVHFELRDRGHLRDPEEVLEHVRRWTTGNRLPERIVSDNPVLNGEEPEEPEEEQPQGPVRLPRHTSPR